MLLKDNDTGALTQVRNLDHAKALAGASKNFHVMNQGGWKLYEVKAGQVTIDKRRDRQSARAIAKANAAKAAT